MTEKFQKETSCKCHCNCNINNNTTWLEALKNDVLKLVDRNEGSMFDRDRINEIGISNYVATLQSPMKMDAPLSVSTYSEIIIYLKYLILFERAERGLKGTQISFGKEEWRPIDCWAEEEWPWMQVPCNPKNLKSSDFPGEGLLIDF